jgi:glutathione peroxidase
MQLTAVLAVSLLTAGPAPGGTPMSVYDFKVKTIDGKEASLADYKGKTLLIVNTASECGYTPQYAGLEALFQKYKARGFTVLAFPSNDFGAQEPGSNAEIKKFCELRYKTTFPLFSKIPVKGPTADPLYKYLTSLPGKKGGDITWNFNKFLVTPDGQVVEHFDSRVEPTSPDLTSKLEQVLPKQG